MKDFKISGIYPVSNTYEITVDYDGYSYLTIFGKHINGGFFCISNWGIGGKLVDYENFGDIRENAFRINKSLNNPDVATAIAEAIALYMQSIN